MSRKSFKSVLRPDLKVQKKGRHTIVSDGPRSIGGLAYRVERANAETAAHLNTKFPIAVLRPPYQ